MNVIEVNNLSKIFGNNPKGALKLLDEGYSKSEILEKTGNTVGVSRATFGVKPGETFVIMGLSGSGKSTLIRLVNRLIEPTEGSIVIGDQDLSKADKKTLRQVRREKLGMVFQSFALFPHRTILENAEFGLEIQGKTKDDRIALMNEGEIVQIGSPEEILVNPANDYVEKFVEDVDRSKILTAHHIMKRPETVNFTNHGPRVALGRMREEGISGVYVVDENRQLKGYVHANEASEAVKKDVRTLEGILKTDVPTVEKDTPMSEIFNIIHDAPIPVAVVDDGRLLGVIVRGAVIAALSEDATVNLDA